MTTATIEHARDKLDHAPWSSAPAIAHHEDAGSPTGWPRQHAVTEHEDIQAHRERIMQALRALNDALQSPLH